MNKSILVIASILGIVGIILGAFAAHGLKQMIALESLRIFETGVKYQMYHALFLLFVGSSNLVQTNYKRFIMWCTIIGIVLFSGSIYGLATNSMSMFNFKSIGFITPIGGLLLILAWTALLVNFLKLKKDKS